MPLTGGIIKRFIRFIRNKYKIKNRLSEAQAVLQSVKIEEAPSDEGAVSEADWGRDTEKSFLNNKIVGEIRIFSLPQSPAAPAPSSEGALGATETYSFSTL